MRSTEVPVEKEEPEFKVDLRIEGIAQDVILEDEEKCVKFKKSLTNYKLETPKSIREDLRKP